MKLRIIDIIGSYVVFVPTFSYAKSQFQLIVELGFGDVNEVVRCQQSVGQYEVSHGIFINMYYS